MMTTIKSNSLGGSGGSNEITLNRYAGRRNPLHQSRARLVVSVNNDYTTTVDKDLVLDITGTVTRSSRARTR